MPVQEAMNLLGQLSANSFRGCNFLHRRFPEAIHGTEFS